MLVTLVYHTCMEKTEVHAVVTGSFLLLLLLLRLLLLGVSLGVGSQQIRVLPPPTGVECGLERLLLPPLKKKTSRDYSPSEKI